MRITLLLLMIALTALATSRRGHRKRSRRELLVRSKRRWVLSTIELEEEMPGPYPKAISQMYNNMSGNHEFRISGMGVDQEPLNMISIDSHTGVVFAHGPIDREIYEKPFHIKFEIYDKVDKKALDKELAFDVELKDINDNPPLFAKPKMTANVKENEGEGYLDVVLEASDRDQANTSNSKITMSVFKQTPEVPKITVHQFDGKIARLGFQGCFNYDKARRYQIIVQAKDEGKPPLSSTTEVTLNVIDTNSHLPTFIKKKYHAEVEEATTKDDIMRVEVEDKDTPNTPGWLAKYTIVQGNDEGFYSIKTDPKTNEGILNVIKGKDYEMTKITSLVIEVENEEGLTICEDELKSGADKPRDRITVTVKVIDINDPPEFRKNPSNVFLKEEEQPGKVLHTPEVYDIDSNITRFVLLDDPAGWVTIDEKTGKVTSAKKMDRESPFVSNQSTYRILIGAVDDGEPITTGTGTILFHLGDINDNKPHLVNKGVIMCGNKVNKVTVAAADSDIHPFSGPFAFSLGGEDKSLEERWKLEPAFGEEGGLVSRKPLPYGNYSVPLVIRDQQNVVGTDTLEVKICDCGEREVCRDKDPVSTALGAPGIGLIFAGLLLFLLLLLVLFRCECGKAFKKIPLVMDEGNQTLIKYNQEGGGSECKSEPILPLTPTGNTTVTDGVKVGTGQVYQAVQDVNVYNSSNRHMFNSNMSNMSTMDMNGQRELLRRGQSMYSSWGAQRTNTYQGSSSQYNRSFSLQSNQRIADHIDRRLYVIHGDQVDHPKYQPHAYAYEGQGSRCHSLDKLSLSNLGDDLTFLNDLGPKFKTLGGICQQTIQEQKIQL